MVDVTNTGTRAGDEVVQLYVRHLDSPEQRSVKDLRGFDRISLAPGEQKTVEFTLSAKGVAHWNEQSDEWVVAPGRVELQVGASSSDIRLTTAVSVSP